MKVLLAGATGLTGQSLLQHCLQRNHQVFAWARTAPSIEHPRLRWLDFEQQPADRIDVFLCTLGTTRKQSGAEGLAWVDRDLVVRCAARAKDLGARSAVVLSAVGANAHSPFLYNRLKGEMQQQLASMGFERLVFVQPSVLLGQRSSPRPLEQWAGRWLAHPCFGRYQALPATQVAEAMWRSAEDFTAGQFELSVAEIQQLNSNKE